MEKMPNKKNEQRKPYEYFWKPEKRQDIYQFSRGVTKYLHDEKIPNIILLDRSPRPFWVGIDEYWKENYKKEKRPNIYFMNPDGFDAVQKAINDHPNSMFDSLIFAATGESEILKSLGLYEKKIEDELKQVYSKLEKDKEKPLAVFDNCIHSGRTIAPILHYLEKYGYKDIRVVIGETSNDISPINIHKDFTNRVQLISCGAFGRDFGVTKEEDSIVSKYDDKADRERVVKSREEIRRIVQEKGA